MNLLQLTLAAMAIALVVPLAALPGLLWRNGAVATMGAGALLAFGANWTIGFVTQFTGGFGSQLVYNVTLNYITAYIFVGGALLLFGGWAIALSAATAARDWRSVAWLVGGVFASVVIFLYGLAGPDNGCFMGEGLCVAANPTRDSVWFLLSSVIGPATLLVFALRAPRA